MPKTLTLSTLLFGALALAPGFACGTVQGDQPLLLPPPEPAVRPGPPAYMPGVRAREQALHARTRSILDDVLPRLDALEQQLVESLRALELPVVLAASDPDLRRWGDEARHAHKAAVDALFDAHEVAVRALHDEAWERAIEAALHMAPERSPMDPGVTGDPRLDRTLVTFDETLKSAFAFENLEADRNEWLLREIELFEAYSTFGDEAAGVLDGRLMLFVGGDELADRPRAVLVLRLPEGVAPSSRGFFQVMRHRIMRGPAMVQDEGWRPANQGVPAVEVADGRYLIATGIEPIIRTDAEGFEQLQAKRIVVDMQSAVFDATGTLLGGIDWRVAFRVTNRGDVAWQLDGGRPRFNTECEYAQGVLDAARG